MQNSEKLLKLKTIQTFRMWITCKITRILNPLKFTARINVFRRKQTNWNWNKSISNSKSVTINKLWITYVLDTSNQAFFVVFWCNGTFKETLLFYIDWYLYQQIYWFTNCQVRKASVLNIFSNTGHTIHLGFRCEKNNRENCDHTSIIRGT